MKYPGRLIKAGETDRAIVTAIIQQLSKRGYRLDPDPTAYDARLTSLIKLFQAQNSDATGRSLKIDGQIGPMTWGALFGAEPKPASAAVAGSLAGAALAKAQGEVGVMEVPPGSNRGPRVEEYLRSVGLDGGYFWCMAFVYWCFREGAAATGKQNLFPKTAGCLDAWNKVKAAYPARAITKAQAAANPALVKPGMVFILDYGGGAGHTGFVKQSAGGALITVEGNTNTGGSNNGVGVFDLNRRNVMDKNLKGFLDFT